MRLYFSGGGSPWTPETFLTDPCVLMTYVHNVKGKDKEGQIGGKPDTRFARLIKARKRTKAREKKGGTK